MLSVIVTIVIIVTVFFMVTIVIIVTIVFMVTKVVADAGEFSHLLCYGLVIVNEEVPLPLIERTDVISVIVKERRLPVG